MQKRLFHQLARTGRARVWTIEVNGAEITTTYGEKGGKLQTVVDVGVRKNVGRSNEVSAEDDAVYEAERAILDKVRQGYAELGTESATEIDWNSTLPVNLRFYKPDNSLSTALVKKLLTKEAWHSRKRDGEMFPLVKGPDGRVDAYSRRMLRSHHLEEGLHFWRERFPYVVEQIEQDDRIPPRSILLGDFVHSPADDGRWEVASFMKSLTPEALQKPPLFYYCWDIAFWDGEPVVRTHTTGDRYALIWETFGRLWDRESWVLPIEVFTVDDVEVLLEGHAVEVPVDPIAAAQMLAKRQGWEGFVDVDPSGVYGDRAFNFRGKTDRPGKFCGKNKPSEEGDFVAFFDPENSLGNGTYGKWGTGNHRGRVGSVSLYQYNAHKQLIYICECGGGIDDKFREEYSDPSSYPLVLQVEYTERTFKAQGDKTDALTHPRVIGVREDKTADECIEDRLG